VSTLIKVFLFACVGVAMEVAFTAAAAYREERSPRLMGKSYLWMFPIYALAYPFLLLLHPLLGHWAWPLRGLLYVALLYGVEFLAGWLLHRSTGACPWDYGQARWSVRGYIRLDYFPAWFCAVLGFERLFVFLR